MGVHKHFLSLDSCYGGLGLFNLEHVYKVCQVQRCLILKNSKNETIRYLYSQLESAELKKSKSWYPTSVLSDYSNKVTSETNTNGPNDIIVMLKKDLQKSQLSHFHALEMQGQVSRVVQKSENLAHDCL
ncbi:hypothetical protein RCL1_000953 [Eukaryota sp. TZLM3-RCL]